jgi:hypothetical protein
MAKNVLYAEDDIAILETNIQRIMQILDKNGIENVVIDTACTGSELLTKVYNKGCNEPYCLILTDNTMIDRPELMKNGFDCLKEIKEYYSQNGKKVPMHLVCAAPTALGELAQEYGFGYIDKVDTNFGEKLEHAVLSAFK